LRDFSENDGFRMPMDDIANSKIMNNINEDVLENGSESRPMTYLSPLHRNFGDRIG
jgi:hypothetical protein